MDIADIVPMVWYCEECKGYVWANHQPHRGALKIRNGRFQSYYEQGIHYRPGDNDPHSNHVAETIIEIDLTAVADPR